MRSYTDLESELYAGTLLEIMAEKGPLTSFELKSNLTRKLRARGYTYALHNISNYVDDMIQEHILTPVDESRYPRYSL